MSDRNEITVRGRLGGDPVRRVGANGRSWVTFRLGSTPRYRDAVTGEFKDDRSEWFTVKAWGELAENVGLSLRKGNPVIVRGKVFVDTWAGENGERWDHVIHADVVALELSRGTATYVRTVREAAAEPQAATGIVTGPDGRQWETEEVPEGEDATGEAGTDEEPLAYEMSAAGDGTAG
ncbi:single-stranded DNA-binding protein [Georgenia sp. AZ-5]|uniref:single-stranded DNA-binding protein n=1 Tax=Georgenia sp. AZ-5 TaxID=3367526 RepID=UPI003754BCF0